MAIYDYNINNQAVEILPPDKRYNNNIALLRGFLSPIQWLVNSFFKSYYEGSTASNYSPGTYNYQNEVIYNKKVYSSLIDNNTDLPTASTWMLIQNDFIGVKERVLYDGSRLILEYALNKQYGGVFRQPQTPEGITDTKSDIYLTAGSTSLGLFNVGKTIGSLIGRTQSSGGIGKGLSLTPASYNFVVNIPATIFATTNNEDISQFINTFIAYSLRFTINII